MKKVSIAMLAYNHEKYIAQAIESILVQETNFDFEIVIGEDCSPDNTLKIINEYKNRYPDKIKVLNREKNIGVVNNVMDVYFNCSGEYIALLEGDDYWTDKKKLQKSIDFLENNREYIGIFHNIEVIDENEDIKIDHPFNRSEKYSDINSQKEHFEGKIMMTLSMVFRNVFLDKKRLEEYSKMLTGISYVCDYSLKSFLLNFGKFKYLDQVMGRYRHITTTGTSWSAQGQLIKDEDFYKIIKNNIQKYGKDAYDSLIIGHLLLILRLVKNYLKTNQIGKLKLLIMDFDFKLIKISLVNIGYQKIKKKYFTRNANE